MRSIWGSRAVALFAGGSAGSLRGDDRSGARRCIPALARGGLLIDPTVVEAKEAINSAYLLAAKDEATLFISFIGHSENIGNDFFLLPKDATTHPLNPDTAVHLVDVIKYAQGNAPDQVDGLGILVDACYSGMAGFGAADAWVAALKGTLRFGRHSVLLLLLRPRRRA
jgi:hypothetical protein